MLQVTTEPAYVICEQKDTDQPVRSRSLISVFVLRSQDRIIPAVSITKYQDSSKLL